MRREVMATNHQTILDNLVMGKDFYVKKITVSIYCDKRVLVSVVITGPASARLDWCHRKLIEMDIDQAAVEQQFSNLVVRGPKWGAGFLIAI